MSLIDPPALLEISLVRGAGDTYTASVHVTTPGHEGESNFAVEGLKLDLAALRRAGDDPAAHGRLLHELLFEHSPDLRLRDAFISARSAANTLRIRLSLAPNAPELHALHWEALADPEHPEQMLLRRQGVLFSRYPSIFELSPLNPVERSELRALVVVADPVDLDRFDPPLVHIKVEDEVKRARATLLDHHGAGIPVTVVTGPSTLDRMREALQSRHQILYLICHGRTSSQGGHYVYLEGDDGNAIAVSGESLTQMLSNLDLKLRPWLVVLAACQSADIQRAVDGSALVALGPGLAEAGIPAVLAMQGSVLMETVERFLPAFFRDLAEHGIVDQAVAAGRSVVDPEEAWRPVLYMRLRHGRVWHDLGFTVQGGTAFSWSGLRRRIAAGEYTAILGPGLLESVFPYRSWLATKWASQHRYPMVLSRPEDLTQVAQFLACSKTPSFPQDQMEPDLAEGLKKHLEADALASAPMAPAGDLLQELLKRRSDGSNPYQILANMAFPVYITVAPDPLLFQALQQARISPRPGEEPVLRRPRRGVLAWKAGLAGLPDPWTDDYEPSPVEPLVFHLFGAFDHPDALVLTEDDYFDFLVNYNKPEIHQSIPALLRERLIDSRMLFLGFSLDAWEFRALFRTMWAHPRLKEDKRPHVAVQVEPAEDQVVDPLAAHEHIRARFLRTEVDTYFGSIERFLRDLVPPTKESSL